MHTSHNALWRPLGRPSALPSSFPRWNSVDQPDYVFLSLPRSSLFSSPHLSPSLSFSFLSLSSSFSCTFYLSLFLRLSSLSAISPSLLLYLSLSLPFSPCLSYCRHIILHIIERRARERKTRGFRFLLLLWCLYAVPVCGLQLKCRSQESLQKIVVRLSLIDIFIVIKAQEWFDQRRRNQNSNYFKPKLYLLINSLLTSIVPSQYRVHSN